MIKKLSIFFFTLLLLRPYHSFSLNSFELSMVGIGIGVILTNILIDLWIIKVIFLMEVKILNMYQNSMKHSIRDESFFFTSHQQPIKSC